MSRWNTISAAEVLEEFTPQEKATLENIQGATNSLGKIVARAINKVRGDCIRGGNRIGPNGTVPDSLAPDVIAWARWKWLISIPAAKSMQTSERKDAYNDAKQAFLDVAKGEPKVELPDENEVLEVTTPGNAAELATQPDPARAAHRRKLDGLL